MLVFLRLVAWGERNVFSKRRRRSSEEERVGSVGLPVAVEREGRDGNVERGPIGPLAGERPPAEGGNNQSAAANRASPSIPYHPPPLLPPPHGARGFGDCEASEQDRGLALNL